MVDYIRHIINIFEKQGFTEEQIEAAIRKFEEKGEKDTISYLVNERNFNLESAAELVSGINKELSVIKRESAIRGVIYIVVFAVIGTLAWMAHGYWIGIIFWILAAYKLIATARYFAIGR